MNLKMSDLKTFVLLEILRKLKFLKKSVNLLITDLLQNFNLFLKN